MLVTKTCLTRLKGSKNLTITQENQTNLISSEPLAIVVNEAEGGKCSANVVRLLQPIYCDSFSHLQYLAHSISNPQ